MDKAARELSLALERGLAAMNLEIHQKARSDLLVFLDQLQRWNRIHNLSGIQDQLGMLNVHLLDSLSLLPLLDGESLADVGCGAGLPGLPLAICCPEKQFWLIDSNGKKTAFVFQVAAQLGLRNIEIVRARAEDYATEKQVAIVTSRAFASLNSFIGSSNHLLEPQGRFLAMKGKYPEAELRDLPAGFYLAASHALKIPGLDASRHVLDIRRTQQGQGRE